MQLRSLVKARSIPLLEEMGVVALNRQAEALILAHAHVVHEGAPRLDDGEARWFGTTMLDVDLGHARFAGLETAERRTALAALLQRSPLFHARLLRLAREGVARAAGRFSPEELNGVVVIRVAGTRLLIDIDVEAVLARPERAIPLEGAGG